MIAVRAVTPEDMPLLESWAKRRGCALSAGLVSPHGFLAVLDDTPIMCAWGAMILDTPFVEIDHVYVSPRATRKTGLEAWARILGAFRYWVSAINEQGGQQVQALKIAMNADMAPYARKTGGAVGNMPLLNCIYSMEVSHGN